MAVATARMRIRASVAAAIAVFVAVHFENWNVCSAGQPTSNADNSTRKNISTQITASSAFIDPAKTEVPARQRTPVKGRRHAHKGSDNVADSQNFFQSLAPLFGTGAVGHSRPLVYPEHSFRPGYRAANYRDLAFAGGNDNILGSGNFGVVKGGTYYAEERDDGQPSAPDDPRSGLPYAYAGGGHRPKKNPPAAIRNGGDFFAHFRDFADITAPGQAR